jgi:ATP-dependent DNA helicase RecQ
LWVLKLEGTSVAAPGLLDAVERRKTLSTRAGTHVTTETKLGEPINELLQGALKKRLKASLRDVFGIDSLRPGQEEVIQSVLDGRDTLAVMPTGAGKSLCYQLPALQLGGLTLVVSPLISLMKDQSDKLRESGIAAVALHSGLSAADERQAIRDIDSGESRFLFLTPERLAKPDFVEMLSEHGKPEVQLVVIDEAHCISQWGHDFRPAFVEMLQSIKALGRPPVLALTATATPAVVADILRELDMKDAQVINTGVYRDNLVFAVEQLTNPKEKRTRLHERIQALEGTGIVYCSTVAECNAVHAELVEAGIEAGRYNGKMSASERTAAQDAFMDNRCRVMVATNAFGMGIDKPDIRFVIHHQMPGSLEAYYQEAGRAGRDGGKAHCILLFELKDKQVQQFFLSGRYPSVETLTRGADALQKLARENDRKIVDTPIDALHEALPDIGKNKLRTVLSVLQEMRMLRSTRKGSVTVLDNDAPHDMQEAAQRFTKMAAHDREVLERMIGYAQSGRCRWRILLDYFHAHLDATRLQKHISSTPDELDGGVCCKCDNCVSPPTVTPSARELLEPVSKLVSKPVSKSKRIAKIWNPGDAVQVRKYGTGHVEMMSGDRVAVSFPDGETRTFIARYVKAAHSPKGETDHG